MDLDISLSSALLLILAGIVGGFVNTLAGGGSMLTLPALMMLGMPPDIANATNRVGVLMQSLTGMREFNRHKYMPSEAIVPVLVPVLAGTLAGALVASYMPVSWLKPVLLITMIAMALAMLLKPETLFASMDTVPYRVNERPAAAAGLFLAGAYGGFVQAGVGFILIAALAGGLRYNLVMTNALKVVCTAALSLLALVVFVARDQVLWVPGLIMAVGTIIGAVVSVRFAIRVQQTTLKWILFVMVSITCLMAWVS